MHRCGVVMAADGGEHRQQKSQEQDSCRRTIGAPRSAEPARATRPTATHQGTQPGSQAQAEKQQEGERQCNSKTRACEPPGHRGLPSQSGRPDRQRHTPGNPTSKPGTSGKTPMATAATAAATTTTRTTPATTRTTTTPMTTRPIRR